MPSCLHSVKLQLVEPWQSCDIQTKFKASRATYHSPEQFRKSDRRVEATCRAGVMTVAGPDVDWMSSGDFQVLIKGGTRLL